MNLFSNVKLFYDIASFSDLRPSANLWSRPKCLFVKYCCATMSEHGHNKKTEKLYISNSLCIYQFIVYDPCFQKRLKRNYAIFFHWKLVLRYSIYKFSHSVNTFVNKMYVSYSFIIAWFYQGPKGSGQHVSWWKSQINQAERWQVCLRVRKY